jgi:cytoskeletal protein CcmA (bactofilin family)
MSSHPDAPSTTLPAPPDGKHLLAVVGSTASLTGKFEISDSIEIECAIAGELKVGGKLVIGQNGVVNADVETRDAVIKGRYSGNLIVRGDCEIAATGHVNGNIETDSLVVAKGGFFNGNVIKSSAGREAETAGAVYLLDERRQTARK